MTHQPPNDPHRWEPEWMKEFREIDQRIAAQLDRYFRSRRRDIRFWFYASFAGYWVGFVTVELLKWSTGLK